MRYWKLPCVTILLLSALVLGCASAGYRRASSLPEETSILETSLFNADQAVLSDESVQRILTSRVVLPPSVRIALLKIPSKQENVRALWSYGIGYRQSEEYLKLQQSYIDTVAAILFNWERVRWVTPLPPLLVPQPVTIAQLREAAVRLQADVLLVYRVNSDANQE
jgi:hypothetical protein